MVTSLFSLANQSLKLSTAADTKAYLDPLVSNPDITTIHLNGNTLGVEACQHLATIISQKKSLQSVNFADIFTSRLVDEIPPALSALLTACLACPQLHTIDLSDNAFGLMTVAPLVAFLKAHVPLRHLILNNNGLGPNAGAMVGEALHELAIRKEEARSIHSDVPYLETIACGRNRLENGSMAAWAKALARHRMVKSVKMTQNGIRLEGIAKLLDEGLSKCKALEVVDLQDNTFTLLGSRALAAAVGHWSELRELGLGDCLMGARGAVVVVDALAKGKNAQLRVVRAQFNDINARGVSTLARAVEKGALPSLRKLELNGNTFSEDEEAIVDLTKWLDGRAAEAPEDERHEFGLDELDELESGDEEDEDAEEEDENESEDEAAEKEVVGTRILKDADEQEDQTVSQKKDAAVDEIADALGKTVI